MPITAWRIVGCVVVSVVFAFLLNNYLVVWRDWPGIVPILHPSDSLPAGAAGLAWGQLSIYLVSVVGAIIYVIKNQALTLREESDRLSCIAAYVVRAAFWAVLLVGFADALISFLRVEGLLVHVVGAELDSNLGRPQYRSPVVHLPLILVSLVIAAFTRSLGFIWLALLVVVAELLIVFSRFVFSYEQAFMGDLVRFWYAALFLFASAYTLLEEGHVRVDVLYAGFSRKTKGLVNAIGSIALGITLCTVILSMGMAGKANIINAPILSIEVSQSGFGMYVKYLMAGFLAVFATSMMIQFAATLLSGIADYRGDPGAREFDNEIAA